MPEPLRLHLGCGQQRREGFINCDLHKTSATDTTFDVQQRWPFDDHSVAEIFSCHMLEHLDDPWAFFRGAWRVLRPTGTITLQLPHGASDEGMSDLTHKRPWFPGSFCAFQPGYGESIGNPQHDWAYPFAVDMIGMRVHKDLLWALWWPWRPLGLKALRYLWGGYVELFVQMTALKTPEQLAAFSEHGHAPNTVPASVVAWQHEWDPLYDGPPALKHFASGSLTNTAPGR